MFDLRDAGYPGSSQRSERKSTPPALITGSLRNYILPQRKDFLRN